MTEDRLVALITRQWSGALTPAEVQELEQWAEEAPQNRRLLNKMSNEEALLEKELRLWKQIDPARGFAAWVSGRKARRRSKIIRVAGWSAAASILVGVLVTGLIRKTVSNTPLKPVVAQSAPTVLPGKNFAVLTLASGQKISLDSSVSGELGVQGNVRVTKLDNGSLAYSSKGKQAEQLFNTLTTPRSGQYQLLLPDGSRVWLNNASTIRYPVAFQGKDRTVELSGEAYFEIVKNVSQPFQVKVNGLSIDVLGTSFNIMAYADEGTINTTLLTGSVRVKQGAASVQLRPDEQVRASSTGGELKVLKNVSAQDVVSWKNGFFYFGQASLKEVMRQLARWYDVDVEYSGPVPDQTFEGKIDRNLPLQELLRFLEKNQLHFRLEGRKIIVLP